MIELIDGTLKKRPTPPLIYAGTPPAEFGMDGDFCFDSVNLLLYGPKSNGAWGAGRELGGTDIPDGTLSGQLLYWDGTQWSTTGVLNRTSKFGVHNTGVHIVAKTSGHGLITTFAFDLGNPSGTAISAGALWGFNGIATNFYGMGLGAARNGKYDIWSQTGASNGGGYRWYIGAVEKITIDYLGRLGISTSVPTAELSLAGSQDFLGQSSTAERRIAKITPSMPVTTDAARTGELGVYVFDYNAVSGRKAISILADGSGTDIRIGDPVGGHYTQIEGNGNVKFVGDAKYTKDEYGLLLGKKFKGSNITENIDEGTLDFSDSCDINDDYAVITIQLNHDRDLTAAVGVHLHWFQASANVPNWYVSYRYQDNGSAKTTAWTQLAWATNIFTYTSGTLNQITTFGTITPPAGSGVSDLIQFRLTRDTANESTLFSGADPLTGDALALSFDVHKLCDSLGSDTEYDK